MTIQIPDDLARDLEAIAAAQRMSVEQLAIERLRALFEHPTSPVALLRAIQALPHPSPSAVDDLEAAIAEGRLPVREQGVFDR
jgi:HEAT repeat protein